MKYAEKGRTRMLLLAVDSEFLVDKVAQIITANCVADPC